MASVSHAGKIVEPKSLSAAIDISPLPEEPPVDNKDGPGPLASAALIEQVKQAGGAEEVRQRAGHAPEDMFPFGQGQDK